MIRARRTRTMFALVIGALALGSGCQRTGDPALDEFLCEVFGVVFIDEVLTLRDGESEAFDGYFVRKRDCTSNGTLTATASNPGAFEFGGVTFAEISPSQAPAGAPSPGGSDDALYHVSMPFRVNLAGNYSVQLRYTNDEAGVDLTRSVSVVSQAARGTINVQISGLPANVPGDVRVDLETEDEQHFTSSGSGKFYAGNVQWAAFSVAGPDGTMYAPTPSLGTVPLAINETKTLSVMYAPDAPAMGMVNLTVGGLSNGLPGSVTVTGNNFNQTFTESSWIPLAAGAYVFTSNTVGNSINDFNDPQPTRQVTVSPGQVTNVAFVYAVIATLVNFNIAGLEAGLVPGITLTRGGETRTITSSTAGLKLAIGLWTVAIASRVINGRTYVGTGTSLAPLNVLAQSSPMAVALAYYCTVWQWQVAATFGIFSDLYGHALFINMLLTAHLLNVVWSFPDPAPAGPPGVVRANQTSNSTVTISGQGAFVQVTGTRAANGSLSLSGSGTVAGYPNVPIALTGTLTNAGALTNVQYRMGQSTPPTGLPNGPIIYTIQANAPPSPPGFDFLGGILGAPNR